MPEWSEVVFEEISFACTRKQPRLQAADLFAHEAMKLFDNNFGPIKRAPRKSWLALHDTGRFHVEAVSDDWFQDLKTKMLMLDESSGQARDDYLLWLKQHQMEHSTTSIFRYIEWKAKRLHRRVE
jgi:hypothetical protein